MKRESARIKTQQKYMEETKALRRQKELLENIQIGQTSALMPSADEDVDHEEAGEKIYHSLKPFVGLIEGLKCFDQAFTLLGLPCTS